MLEKSFNFLKKGEGKLASQNHGISDFAILRKSKVIKENLERENIEKHF